MKAPIQFARKTGRQGSMNFSFAGDGIHYLQEALGLAIFMIAACFFGSLLQSPQSSWQEIIPSEWLRLVILAITMGVTAIFIFYFPFTAASGSHINPAVTITFWRLGKMNKRKTMFYILSQFMGGTLAVYIMRWFMGDLLIDPPINSIATVPQNVGLWPVLTIELLIAFLTMVMILFTSENTRLKKYTRILSGVLVAVWVILAGPVTGFGMNPARTFASALPANTWTGFWIYMISPVGGMLSAAEFFLFIRKKRKEVK